MRKGFLMWEVLVAIVLLSAVGVLLITALHARQKIDARLDMRTAAIDAARGTLLHRQAGQAYTPPAGIEVKSRILDTPAVAGKQWIAVRATVGNQHVELIGLAPTESRQNSAGVP